MIVFSSSASPAVNLFLTWGWRKRKGKALAFGLSAFLLTFFFLPLRSLSVWRGQAWSAFDGCPFFLQFFASQRLASAVNTRNRPQVPEALSNGRGAKVPHISRRGSDLRRTGIAHQPVVRLCHQPVGARGAHARLRACVCVVHTRSSASLRGMVLNLIG